MTKLATEGLKNLRLWLNFAYAGVALRLSFSFFLDKKVEQKSQGKRECSAALPGQRTTVSMHPLLVVLY